MEIMKSRGHNMVWNAIRYKLSPSALFALAPHITFFFLTTRSREPHKLARTFPIQLPHLLHLCLFIPARIFSSDSSRIIKMAKATGAPHAWDTDTEVDLMKVLNTHFRPNAEDCKKMNVLLNAKGYKFTDNALLYGFLLSSFPVPHFCTSTFYITFFCCPSFYLTNHLTTNRKPSQWAGFSRSGMLMSMMTSCWQSSSTFSQRQKTGGSLWQACSS